MNIQQIAENINNIKKQVQKSTFSYMMDPDCTEILDLQLNGYMKALRTYCLTNAMSVYVQEIDNMLPIERNAIEFFCFWDGIESQLLEYEKNYSGKRRSQVIYSIAYELQSSMTKKQIDGYLNGFGIEILDTSDIVSSKRVYVEDVLKDADSICILNIAKDLNLLSPDIIETEIGDKSSHEFVEQQISKCKAKMNAKDFDGAITNARTLTEEVLLCIEEKIEGSRQDYDGNIGALYKRVSKQINMYPDDSKVNNSFNEILRGFLSIINGFASLSNNIGDRHATAKHPEKHHAKIAVNGAMIICEFLIDSFEYQQQKGV